MIIAGAALSALPPVQLDRAGDRADLSGHLEVLEDPGGSLGVEEVAAGPAAGRFRPMGRVGGPLPSVFWLRAALANAGPSPAEWALAYPFPYVEHVDLYTPSAGGHARQAGGLAVPPAERALAQVGTSHEGVVRLRPGETAAFLLRVETRGSLLMVPELWRPPALAREHRLGALVVGVGFGALLLLALLQLYGALVLRLSLGVQGGAMVLLGSAMLLVISGYGPTLILPGAATFWMRATTLVAAATAIAAVQYARGYLDTRHRDPSADRLLRVFSWLLLLAGLAGIPWRGGGAVAVAAAAIGVMVAIVAAALRAWRQGVQGAGLYLVSMGVASAFGTGYGFTLAGLAPPGQLAYLGVAFGLLAGFAVFTHGGIERAVLAHRAARGVLEAEVANRTRALDEAVRRLRGEVEDRRRALEALAESEERFRVAFEHSPDAIAFTRQGDQALVAVNQGFERLTGWGRGEVLGRRAGELGLWPEVALPEGTPAAEGGRGPREVETLARRRDGTLVQCLGSAQLIRLQGEPYQVLVLRDISAWRRAETDRARLQEELQQAQKMEAIGRLAGGVAHDFNNLLTVIQTNASLGLMDLPEADPSREAFTEIRDATQRATGLTRQLLAFGRRQVLAPQPLDLSGHVGGMRTMLRRLLAEDVELAFDLDGGLPPVLADRAQVEQVVVNLGANARDALPGGGRIRFATGLDVVLPDQASDDRPRGRYGVLSVADNGMGIGEDVRPHIFEPFFTTKKKGSGLGLATVYGIARQHGGFVDVESTPGLGSTFRVFFPLAHGPAQPAAAANGAETGPGPRGTETILVAEDEPGVRAATRALLTRLGYTVLEAGDGREALAVSDAYPGPIHLLLTDVVMPRMNGRELARELQKRRPGVPVLYVSGYSEEVITRGGQLEPGITLLQKPFEPLGLARAVRRLVDETRGQGSRAEAGRA